jgi:hypothetical protein
MLILGKISGGPQRREPILSETLAQWKKLAEADLGSRWQGICGEVVEFSCEMLFLWTSASIIAKVSPIHSSTTRVFEFG